MLFRSTGKSVQNIATNYYTHGANVVSGSYTTLKTKNGLRVSPSGTSDVEFRTLVISNSENVTPKIHPSRVYNLSFTCLNTIPTTVTCYLAIADSAGANNIISAPTVSLSYGYHKYSVRVTVTSSLSIDARFIRFNLKNNNDISMIIPRDKSIEIRNVSIYHESQYHPNIKRYDGLVSVYDGNDTCELYASNKNKISVKDVTKNSDGTATTKMIGVNPNSTLYFSNNNAPYNCTVAQYDEMGILVRTITCTNGAINIPSFCYWIVVKFAYTNGVQLEESDTITDYEQNKTITRSLRLDEPLRSLSSNVKDTVLYSDGRYRCLRMTGEVILDGVNYRPQLLTAYTLNNTYLFRFQLNDVGYYRGVNSLLSDRFTNSSNYTTLDNELVSAYGTSAGYIFLRISKDRIGAGDPVTQLIEYLKNNNLKIIYTLKDPVLVNLEYGSFLDFVPDANHCELITNSDLQPSVTIDLPYSSMSMCNAILDKSMYRIKKSSSTFYEDLYFLDSIITFVNTATVLKKYTKCQMSIKKNGVLMIEVYSDSNNLKPDAVLQLSPEGLNMRFKDEKSKLIFTVLGKSLIISNNQITQDSKSSLGTINKVFGDIFIDNIGILGVMDKDPEGMFRTGTWYYNNTLKRARIYSLDGWVNM